MIANWILDVLRKPKREKLETPEYVLAMGARNSAIYNQVNKENFQLVWIYKFIYIYNMSRVECRILNPAKSKVGVIHGTYWSTMGWSAYPFLTKSIQQLGKPQIQISDWTHCTLWHIVQYLYSYIFNLYAFPERPQTKTRPAGALLRRHPHNQIKIRPQQTEEICQEISENHVWYEHIFY